MAQTIDAKKYEFLTAAIAGWQEQELLSKEQANQMLAAYTREEPKVRLMYMLGACGALLLGESAIASVASNSYAPSIKMLVDGLFLVLMMVAFAFGYKAAREGQSRWYSESLFTLGAFLYAAAIAISTQLFNWSGNHGEEYVVFAAGLIGLAVVCRSWSLALICSAIPLVIESNSSVFSTIDWRLNLLLPFAGIALSYVSRNRWSLFLALLALECAGVQLCESGAADLLILGSFALFGAYKWHIDHDSFKIMATPYLVLAVFTSILIACNAGSLGHHAEHPSISYIAALISVASLSLIGCMKSPQRWTVIDVLLPLVSFYGAVKFMDCSEGPYYICSPQEITMILVLMAVLFIHFCVRFEGLFQQFIVGAALFVGCAFLVVPNFALVRCGIPLTTASAAIVVLTAAHFLKRHLHRNAAKKALLRTV